MVSLVFRLAKTRIVGPCGNRSRVDYMPFKLAYMLTSSYMIGYPDRDSETPRFFGLTRGRVAENVKEDAYGLGKCDPQSSADHFYPALG